jgi:predicted RNA-binding Zn ribbon-like protein
VIPRTLDGFDEVDKQLMAALAERDQLRKDLDAAIEQRDVAYALRDRLHYDVRNWKAIAEMNTKTLGKEVETLTTERDHHKAALEELRDAIFGDNTISTASAGKLDAKIEKALNPKEIP